MRPYISTDQKVGGSSPSERATETPGQRHHTLFPEASSSSSGRIWRISQVSGVAKPIGVAVHIAGTPEVHVASLRPARGIRCIPRFMLADSAATPESDGSRQLTADGDGRREDL